MQMFLRLVEALRASDGGLMAAAQSALKAHWHHQPLNGATRRRLRRKLSFHSAGRLLHHNAGLFLGGSLQPGSFASAAESSLHHFIFSISALFNNQEWRSRSKKMKSQNEFRLLTSSYVYEAYADGHFVFSLAAFAPWVATSTLSKRGSNLYSTKASISGSGQSGSHKLSDGEPQYGRFWTNFILGLNMLIFLAQSASRGRLLLLGAKVNSLIDKGQMWRLITPALLHANLGHLLVNSYSLNAIGPTVEALGGSKRFLAVYAASAVASSTLSYFLCKAPSVGASGAIFGLVGAFAVFVARHKSMLSGGQDRLSQVARVIMLNMVFGLVTEGVDNWGHLGGLIGGGSVAWLLGPAFTFELQEGRKRLLVDRPPILFVLQLNNKRDS